MDNIERIKWIGLAVLGILLFFSIRSCTSFRQQAITNFKNLELQKDSFEVIVNSKGETNVKQSQVLLQKQSQIKKLAEEVEGLKRIKSQVKIKTITEIRDVEVLIDNPIVITTKDSNCLKLPITFSTKDKWYELSGNISSLGSMTINSLVVNSSPTITFGDSRKKWYQLFKKPERVINFTDQNPYTSVKDMSNLVLDESKKSPFSIGVHAGYGVTKVGLSPVISIGLNYKLIQF